MIKTSIMGLGNIGYFYDIQNQNKKLTHFSSIKKSNKFKLVSLADKNSKILKYLKKKHKIPIYKDIIQAINNHSSKFLIIACKVNFKIIIRIIKETKIKYILAEKPFLISKKDFAKLKKILKKKKIFFSLNFQRNFSDKYIKHFRDIKRGLIGKKLKIFCYYNKDFYSNATHLLNLVLLLGKKNLSLKKISPTSLYLKSKYFELYFFNISEQYNHNSLVVFGSKGRFEFSSRPETGKIYLKYKDTNYKDVNILKLKRKVNLIEKHPQHNVLKDVYKSFKYNKSPSLSMKDISLYLKCMEKIQKII